MCKKSDRKFFLCSGQAVTADKLGEHPNSHIVGELRYVMDGEKKVTALAVYEISRFIENVPNEMPEIRVDIIGDARRIQCTRCDSHQRWMIGKAAFLQLMSRYPSFNANHV